MIVVLSVLIEDRTQDERQRGDISTMYEFRVTPLKPVISQDTALFDPSDRYFDPRHTRRVKILLRYCKGTSNSVQAKWAMLLRSEISGLA